MIKKTQTQDVQQQQTGNSSSNRFGAPGNVVERKGAEEMTDMELVIGNQHPISFPNSLNSNVASPQTLADVVRSIQPSAMHQLGSIGEDGPGAYAVDGIRRIFYRTRCRPLTGGLPDMEGLGLELVPTSQDGRGHDNALVHADPVDEPEYGMIPTAEPLATRAKRLWKKKLFFFLSLEAIIAQLLVVIILVAFLLAPKSSNQTQSAKQQHGVIPIQKNAGTIASITQAPISLWEILNLPEYSLRAMENPRSPQTKAYQWLSKNVNNSNNTQHLPVWRLKQRFALATFYYSTRGDYWVKNQGWLDWDTSECDWAQTQWFEEEAACDDNGKLLSLKFGYANNFYANNLVGTIPPEISLLCDSLETLSLNQNLQLKGNIPTEVGLMTRLTVLLFSITHLSGTLPTELGQLQSLESLSIAACKLDGTLPTQLGNLSKLAVLGFDGANFSGSIPAEILGLSNLKRLGFRECPRLDTKSFLTEVIRNLNNLKWLSLGSGKTGGFTSIPSEIGELTNLVDLILADFQLNGTIPSEMGLLTKLKYLDLQRNSIKGSLPEEFSKLSQLRVLFLHSNQLEGRPLEPELLPQLTQLRWLHINDNLFSGSIATDISLLSSLEELELQNTNLSGTLPKELLLLDNLTSLVLMNTSLSGSMPDELCGVILSPHEVKRFGGNFYSVPTTNLSVCYGTSLCGCTCEGCP